MTNCIICGGEIPAARLEIAPHAKTCRTACAKENHKNRLRINQKAYMQRKQEEAKLARAAAAKS